MMKSSMPIKIRICSLALFIILTVSLFMGSFAQAARGGGIDSGGGGAFLCQNVYTIEEPGGAPIYVQAKSYLLDLWEAQFLQKLEIIRSNENEFIQLRSAFEKLRPFDSSLPDYLYNLAVKLDAEKKSLEDGVELEPPRDANSNYKMRNCKLVGMMFYDQEIGKVSYDNDVYSLLASKTDIAAAMAHEAWYYFVREQYAETIGYLPSLIAVQDSTRSRKMIGCLFSTSKNCLSPTQAEENFEQDAMSRNNRKFECTSENSAMTVYSQISGLIGDADLRIHQITGRRFEAGLFGKLTYTYGTRLMGLEPSRLRYYDLLSLRGMPEFHQIVGRSNEKNYDGTFLTELKQIILLKQSKFWFRNSSYVENGPLKYEKDELIDILNCRLIR